MEVKETIGVLSPDLVPCCIPVSDQKKSAEGEYVEVSSDAVNVAEKKPRTASLHRRNISVTHNLNDEEVDDVEALPREERGAIERRAYIWPAVALNPASTSSSFQLRPAVIHSTPSDRFVDLALQEKVEVFFLSPFPQIYYTCLCLSHEYSL